MIDVKIKSISSGISHPRFSGLRELVLITNISDISHTRFLDFVIQGKTYSYYAISHTRFIGG